MIIAAVLICLAIKATFSVELECQNFVTCPCGNSGENITVCAADNEVCSRFLNCETCDERLIACSKCPTGFERPLCSQEIRKSRPKRQSRRTSSRRWRPAARPVALQVVGSSCVHLESPKLGSIRCTSSVEQQTCTGQCLPGYRFTDGTLGEMTLRCNKGTWTPRTEFPDCISGGHCDLAVQGSGSFNCTTGMDGTRCDVRCSSRYVGRFFCYPGRAWEPALPPCVRRKDMVEDRYACQCQNGGTCDGNGNCVCPAGRTGTYCETALPEKRICRDPGFISNGNRRNMDGFDASTRRNFEERESVVYICQSEAYALRGSSLLTCRSDGTWSSPLPTCTKSATAAPERKCPDPGQVTNAERLNSDGSPSFGIQEYRLGQSVVYTCHPGFALQRRSLITCLASGAWSFRTPYCRRVVPVNPEVTTAPAQPSMRFCRDPGVDPNGHRVSSSPSSRRGFPQGAQLEYSCNQLYDLIGESILFCYTSGDWSASRPRCREKPVCSDLGSISNGHADIYLPSDPRRIASTAREYPEGTHLQYSCDSGYVLEGQPTLTCEHDGFWSDIKPSCKTAMPDSYCTDLGPIPNGHAHIFLPSNLPLTEQSAHEYHEYPEGTRLQYSCGSGYVLEGQATLICEHDGFWSHIKPTCKTDADQRRYCRSPGEIENGIVLYVPSINKRRRPSNRDDESEDQYPVESQLQYSCYKDYRLEGPVTLTCEDTGKWSAAPPKCTQINPDEMHYCDAPERILNGRLLYFPPAVGQRTAVRPVSVDYDLDEYPEGGVIEYFCDEGYRLEGKHSSTCLPTGSWSEKLPACVSDCGLSFAVASNRVFMGERANSGEWPWVVSISAVYSNTSMFICGGAVLDTQTVITAGHCLVSGVTEYILRFGKHHYKIQDDDSGVIIRKSIEVIVHPDYIQTNFTLDNDIGLLRFQPKIEYSKRVQPICLPTRQTTFQNIATGKLGYVSGWGETENNAPPDTMMMTSLPVVNAETCVDVFKQQNVVISRNMFCAGHEDSRQTVCGGDSGSPLVFYDSSTQRYTLEGLVSFGVRGQCGSSGKYAIFTKVFKYILWIYRQIHKNK